MTEQLPNYPKCGPAHVYENRELFICPEYGHEWSPIKKVAKEGLIVKNSNGNLLAGGNNVTVIKDLKVKDASGATERGTKVKDIRLAEGDHSIDCEVDGSDPMKLRSESVKKN